MTRPRGFHQPLGPALADAPSFTSGVPTEPEPFTSPLDLTRPGLPTRCPAAGTIKRGKFGPTP
jgi:hypothetical protein